MVGKVAQCLHYHRPRSRRVIPARIGIELSVIFDERLDENFRVLLKKVTRGEGPNLWDVYPNDLFYNFCLVPFRNEVYAHFHGTNIVLEKLLFVNVPGFEPFADGLLSLSMSFRELTLGCFVEASLCEWFRQRSVVELGFHRLVVAFRSSHLAVCYWVRSRMPNEQFKKTSLQ